MSWTFVACILIAFAWMGLFFLWGKSFLTLIHAKHDIESSIVFGFLVLQTTFQLVYLPFFLIRGSYRALSYSWTAIIVFLSIILLNYLRKHPSKQKRNLNRGEKIGIIVSASIVLGLAFYIALHVPFYGQDTMTYISEMNQCYYNDSMWITDGKLYFHSGMCSIFEMFTVASLLTGIKPYYISLFTMRIVGVCLSSLIIYHIGITAFSKKEEKNNLPALVLAALVPVLLMFWGSNYTAEFFYWRINEAKGYCQFVLLPIGFSVFLEMFKENAGRKALWKKQLLVGLAAVSVSASSLTPYLFLLLMGTFALLLFDKFKKCKETVGRSIICAIPNIVYLILYILESKGIMVL